MEWKIGEIKQIKGEWYQCVKGESEEKCTGCFFKSSPICIDLNCLGNERKDHTKVIFKKLEKVGEPYPNADKLYQLYILPMNIEKLPTHTEGINLVRFDIVEIEIKQNKEDMKEKKLNLKPFDIQKAREGKPVCTRDGRKARIICFDAKGDPCPIIALVEENGIEAAYHYDKNGQNAYNKSELDLMMLSEKKSGWANIVIGSDGHPHMGRGIFQSKEAAEDAIKAFSSKLIDTIKVEWYE